jgi:hypothetical protein
MYPYHLVVLDPNPDTQCKEFLSEVEVQKVQEPVPDSVLKFTGKGTVILPHTNDFVAPLIAS